MEGTYECDFIAPVERSPDYVTSLIERFTIVEATLAVPAQIFSRIFLRPLELHLKIHPRNSFTQKSGE